MTLKTTDALETTFALLLTSEALEAVIVVSLKVLTYTDKQTSVFTHTHIGGMLHGLFIELDKCGDYISKPNRQGRNARQGRTCSVLRGSEDRPVCCTGSLWQMCDFNKKKTH